MLCHSQLGISQKKKKKGTEKFEANSDFSVFYLWKEGRGNFL